MDINPVGHHGAGRGSVDGCAGDEADVRRHGGLLRRGLLGKGGKGAWGHLTYGLVPPLFTS